MTTDYITRYVQQRPFEPFTVVTTDGREFHVSHPEFATLGEYAATVIYLHPTGQKEIVDVSMIVSIRTIRAADAVT